MNNDAVILRWLEGKPGANGRRSLTTDGIDLRSYDMLIGGTDKHGGKHVLVAWGVSATTTEHINAALYTQAPECPARRTWSAVDGDGLTLATMAVFPHDVLVTLQGHENDPESVPVPEPTRDPLTDFHPGATVEIHGENNVTLRGELVYLDPQNGGFEVTIRTVENGSMNFKIDASGTVRDNAAIRLVVVKPHYTKVVFRVWNNDDGSYGDAGNDVIALFPELPGDTDPATCESFMHVGQHGSASVHHVWRATRRANKGEYLPLLRELESAPYFYRLQVRQKITRAAHDTRMEALRAGRP